MPASGDLRGMGQLARNIAQLARVPSRAAALAAPGIAREIQHEFDRGVDPYGRPWKPLKPSTLARGRHPPPLTDTREMRDGIAVRPLPAAGIAITFARDVPAIFHQRGTRFMALRAILPTNVLPKAWGAILAAASRRAFGGQP